MAGNDSRIFTDMMGSQITLNWPPQRIVSLVPSQTELLYDLGLNDEVTGITKFCVHPEQWYRSKKRVGGTKTLHLDIIAALEPDLLIANKEENTQEQIEELAQLYPTWISDIKNIADALSMITAVGELVGREDEANALVQGIAHKVSTIKKTEARQRRAAYFIWRKPWMCAGGDTFISNLIETIGWENVMADRQRYPETTLQALAEKQTDIVLLSSEPYPFKEAHVAEIEQALPGVQVLLVDGEMFSWYGSRMLPAMDYLENLITQTQSY